MSRIIKAGSGDQIARFSGPALAHISASQAMPTTGMEEHRPATSEDETISHLKGLLVRAERETERLQQQVEEIVARAEGEEAAIFERGKREGLQQSDEEAAARLAVLERALASANAGFAGNNVQLEMLALQIARATLSRILGSHEEHDTMLRRLIGVQIERFAAERPASLRVSKADFPDAAALGAIVGFWPEIKLVADPKLAPGECLIGLELGDVAIGLPGQRARMQAFFDALVEEREANLAKHEA